MLFFHERMQHDGRARGSSRLRFLLALAGILILATVLRLTTWSQVFTADGIRFMGDDDTYYHVLRAQRIASDYPHISWFDSMMNYPKGASILSPPLFDQIIATTAYVITGGHPQPDTIARVAAFVPLVFAIATLPVIAAIGTLLWGDTVGLLAALFVALLPAHAELSVFGRPDQHVAELFFFSVVILAFVTCWREPKIGLSLAVKIALLGLGITLSFWNWMGSALNLLFLITFTLIWHVSAPRRELANLRIAGSLAAGSAIGAALLAASILFFGEPGALRSMRVGGLGGLHVMLTAATALFAGGLWVTQRRSGHDRLRVFDPLIAAAIVIVAMWAVVPGVRAGIFDGLKHLFRGDPWYRNIQEYDSLFFAGMKPISAELSNAARLYGFLPIIALFAIPHLFTTWKREPTARPQVLFIALFGLVFFILALAQLRFAGYFALPLALWAAIAVSRISEMVVSRVRSSQLRAIFPGILCIAILAPAFVGIWANPLAAVDAAQGELIHMIEWLRNQPPAPDQPGVMAEWGFGHAIQYFAQKPVLVNPFGTDLGPEGMHDSTAFFLTNDASAAKDILNKRRLGFVVLRNPLTEAYYAHSFAQRGVPLAVAASYEPLHGMSAEPTDFFWSLIVTRLYFFDGARSWLEHQDDLEGYRLLYESETQLKWRGLATQQFKVFGVVPGVHIMLLAAPDRDIVASVTVRTNRGRDFIWRASTRTGSNGVAILRIPYATGANGAASASAIGIRIGRREKILKVTSEQVEFGENVTVNLK